MKTDRHRPGESERLKLFFLSFIRLDRLELNKLFYVYYISTYLWRSDFLFSLSFFPLDHRILIYNTILIFASRQFLLLLYFFRFFLDFYFSSNSLRRIIPRQITDYDTKNTKSNTSINWLTTTKRVVSLKELLILF